MKGWMYILECNDGSYYTGSTNNLELRLQEHSNGEGANHTKKRLPVKLIILRNLIELMKLFIEKSKCKAGVVKRKRL